MLQIAMAKKPVGTQYIICECGDNFPSETLLNFHLLNDHADVETFPCEYCSEIFLNDQLYKHHIKQHNVQKPENKPSQNPRRYSDTSPEYVVKKEPKSETDTSPENDKKEPKPEAVIKYENQWNSVTEQFEVVPEIAAEEIAETDTLPSEDDGERVQSQEEPLKPTESQDYSIEDHQGMETCVIAESIKIEETNVFEEPEQIIYFKCDLCNVLYPSEKAYNSHYNKKHCGAQFGFQFIEQDLEGPYLPPPKQQEVHCELCNRTFLNKRSYGIHYRRVHCPQPDKKSRGKASREYECEICGKKSISNFNLVNHQRTHTGEKPYQCSKCPKRFSVQQLLQIHFRTHTGEKPYICAQCPKAFVNKAALNRHDRVHTGSKPYSCQQCGKSFTQSNSMKLHVKTVHLKLPAPYRHRRNKNE